MNDFILLAVTGNPIGHSKSPSMHNAAFADLGIDAVYTRIAADSAKEALQTAKEIGISGMNITNPFKEDFLKLTDSLDQSVKVIGAMNAITIDSRAKTRGYNTDVYGVSASFAENGIKVKGRNALVLGAGGAAKAAAYGLVSAGAKIIIANRTVEKARLLADKFRCDYCSLEKNELKEKMSEIDIVIGTISTGERIIPAELLRKNIVVLDANYSVKTMLVQDAEKIGCKTIDAREWLLYQGAKTFEIFTGKKPNIEVMQKAVYSQNKAADSKGNIALIGFMGSGKTTISNELAGMTKMKKIDIDSEIERKTGMKISKIFEDFGEEAFRKMESEEVEQLKQDTNNIISCGGGVILKNRNIKSLKIHSTVIWLWAKPKIVMKRIKGDKSRPLFNVKNKKEIIERILEARMPLYAAAADLLINTNIKNPKQISNKILTELKRK